VATHPVLTGDFSWILLLVAGLVVAEGLVVLWGRRMLGPKGAQSGDGPVSLIRSWIALSLVSALVLFCAAAFLVDDTALRSALFGGLVTAVGAAVAFYFSSSSADQARKDVMTATTGTTEVPDLVGDGSQTVADARKVMAEKGLVLGYDDPGARPTDKVGSQSIPKGMSIKSNSVVTITTEPDPASETQVPDLSGKTLAEAYRLAGRAMILLDVDGPNADAATVIDAPRAGTTVPKGSHVKIKT
jgi:PASTA domain